MAMGTPPSNPLKLGRIGFLNVLPIFHPLESGLVPHPFRFVTGTPACLNTMMSEGSLDLGVVSSIEYARNHERYHMLPALSISSRGEVRSVLLLSRLPVDELEGREILVTAQSATSVALLKILLQMRYGIRCRFQAGFCTRAMAGPEPPQAVLVIGDEALRLRNHGFYPHRLDLGKAWMDWTEQPFVFAVWVVQKTTAARESRRINQALEALGQAREWGRSHLEEVSLMASKVGPLDCRSFEAYYRCLDYDLDSDQQKGLLLFYQLAHRIGELSAVPTLNLYSPLACVA